MAAHRERRRKNLFQFTVAVAADDIAVIARSGYPEVQAEDENRRGAQPLHHRYARRSIGQGNGVTTCNAVSVTVLPPMQRRFTRPENSVGAVRPPVAGPRARALAASERS